MSGGGSMQPVQSSVSGGQPWAAAQPALKTSLDAAQNLYNSGIGAGYYTGSTVVPFAQQTTQGMNTLQNTATGAQPAFNTAFQNAATQAGYGGLNPLQQTSVDQLAPMAAGDMLVKNNPFTDAVVNKQADLINQRVGNIAQQAGRWGSGDHTALLTRELGDLANQAYSQDYNRERQYMQDAIGSRFNAGQQQMANVYQAPSGLQGAYGAQQTPANTLIDVGAMNEDLATRQLNDQLRLFDAAQQTPWQQVARLNAIGAGAGALGSSGTQTTYAQGPSGLQQGLGTGLTGLGLLGALSGNPAAVGLF